MHPGFEHRLRPTTSVIFIFLAWFCTQTSNEVLALQASTSIQDSTPSTVASKAKTATEAFEENLRLIKRKIHSLVKGDVSQKMFSQYLKSFDKAREEISSAIGIIRQEIDRLAFSFSFERGGDFDVSLKVVIAQQNKLRESMNDLSLGEGGLEAFLDDMEIPQKLRQDHLRTKIALKKQIQKMSFLLQEMRGDGNRNDAIQKEAHRMFIHSSGKLFTALKIHRTHLEKISKTFNPQQKRAKILDQVLSIMNNIMDENRNIRDDFFQMEDRLKKAELPEGILKRHAEIMQTYNDQFQGLHNFLKEIDQANKAYTSATQKNDIALENSREERLRSKLKAFDLFLQKNVNEAPHTIYEPSKLP